MPSMQRAIVSGRWCPIRWIAAFAVVIMTIGPARASELSDALTGLASSDRGEVRDAVTDLANSQDERALVVLQALSDGALRVGPGGAAFITTEAGLVDARSGEPAAADGALKSPLVNNALRRVLAPALAQLQIRAKDVEVRRKAADELSKSPRAELLPMMQAALEKEQDGEVSELLSLAVAQINLKSENPALRIEALQAIRAAGAVSLKVEVERLAKPAGDGGFLEQDVSVRREARATLNSLEMRAFLINSVANLFYGLSLGSVLLLAALGLAITFGLMRVINMAHGEMLMLGAYSTFVVQNAVRANAPSLFDYYLVLAVPAAFGVCALVGLILERTVIRFLYGRPLETLLATWGISLGLIQTVRLGFGAQNVAVANPAWLSGGWELMPTVVLPYSRIGTIVFSIIVVAFVWWLLQRTRLGMYVRAVTQNRAMAANMGIPTQRIDMWTFALGSGVAGLGGVALSQLGNVGPELGQGYIVDSFMVVVLGGVGNIAGTIAGALGLGVVNKFLEPVTGAVLGKIMLLALLILFIQWRPQGMFALKGRAAEVG